MSLMITSRQAHDSLTVFQPSTLNRRFEVKAADLAFCLAVRVDGSLGRENRLCCDPNISDIFPATTVDASKTASSCSFEFRHGVHGHIRIVKGFQSSGLYGLKDVANEGTA